MKLFTVCPCIVVWLDFLWCRLFIKAGSIWVFTKNVNRLLLSSLFGSGKGEDGSCIVELLVRTVVMWKRGWWQVAG